MLFTIILFVTATDYTLAETALQINESTLYCSTPKGYLIKTELKIRGFWETNKICNQKIIFRVFALANEKDEVLIKTRCEKSFCQFGGGFFGVRNKDKFLAGKYTLRDNLEEKVHFMLYDFSLSDIYFEHCPKINCDLQRRPASTKSQTRKPNPGDNCDGSDLTWYSVDSDPTKFIYCDSKTNHFILDSCAVVGKHKKIFDEVEQHCIAPPIDPLHSPGIPRSSRFGEPCVFNTDCLSNMYCPAGTCLCLSGFIDVDSDCYTIVNPGQAGCISNRQCDAVWPGAQCINGMCQCPQNKRAVETRDGWVCVSSQQCPLPEGSDNTPVASGSTFYPSQLTKGAGDDSSDAEHQCEYNKNNDDNDVNSCTAIGQDGVAKIAAWDLYDCIPSGDPGVTSAGMCCPNRALTCIQKKTGAYTSTSTTENRYWYNSVTGSCEQFLWDTASSAPTSANNFKTSEQCRNYCQTTCKRGNPQYSTGAGPSSKPVQCTSNSACQRSSPQQFQCTSIGAKQYCCPATEYICSNYGGRAYVNVPSGYDAGGNAVAGDTTLVNTRWFYNTASKICEMVTYKGHAGNFNSFHTNHECTAFCAKALCDRGEPLRDVNGNNQQCSGGRGCPSSYECKQNVCCPRKQTVCVQPKIVGTCTSALTRYWYNAGTRDCEQFTYTGCNGNDNNFETYVSCQNFCRDTKPEPKCLQGEADKDSAGNYYSCSLTTSGSNCRLNYECYFDGFMFGCCPSKSWTCTLNRQPGTSCVTSTVRWFFDPTSKSCQTFQYMGCDGNSNNFQTKQQCEQFCGVGGCPYGGEPFSDPNTMQRRVCNAMSSPCPAGYECSTVSISGSTINYCCPSKAYICGLSPNQGTQCGSTLQRFYFNIATKACSTFSYFGCGGNENNFATLSQCNNFCNSAACGAGESVYLDPNSQKPWSCNIALQDSCPPGFACKIDTLTNKYVCCGSSDMGVCPSAEKAYIEVLSQTIRECQPGITGSCPNNFLCRANRNRNRYYCCAPNNDALCPIGKAIFRDSLSRQPQTCFFSTINSCPSGYSCQATITGIQQGFCCSVNAICPNSADYFIDSQTGNPRTCVITKSDGFTQCPTGYVCQTINPSSTSGFCCKAVSSSKIDPQSLETGSPNSIRDGEGCPPGTDVFKSAGSIKQCDLINNPNCPNGYSCQYNAISQSYQCCGNPPALAEEGCSPGQIAYKDELKGDSIKECNLGSSSSECPIGYACQYSVKFSRSQCCGVSAGCPDSSVAYIDPSSGRAQTCSASSSCPSGFACKPLSGGESVCCSTKTEIPVPSPAKCPAGKFFPTPGNPSQPKSCSESDPCPTNFDCLPSVLGPICCPSKITTCSQFLDPGTKCGQTVPRHYYNSQIGTCQQFTYNGCSGNDNNFVNIQDCDNFCAKAVCPRGTPSRSGSSFQTCIEDGACPSGYHCISPLFGPADRKLCCPAPLNICSSPMDQGLQCNTEPLQQTSTVQRYFYNSLNKNCEQFSYHGCGGNGNNFYALADCHAYCHPPPTVPPVIAMELKCPFPHQKVFIPQGLSSPQTCTPGLEDCPPGFTCYRADDESTFICCTAQFPKTGGECPQDSQVFINPATKLPQACTANYGPCPTGYSCHYSQQLRQYYCCAGISQPATNPMSQTFIPPFDQKDDGCPVGQAHYYQDAIEPTLCPLGDTQEFCPAGYSCIYSEETMKYMCCSDTGGSVTPLVQPSSGSALDLYCYGRCSPRLSSRCAIGFTCRNYEHAFQCCKSATNSMSIDEEDLDFNHGCRHGSAYLYPSTNEPLHCTPDSACPEGYVCEFSTLNQEHQCCSGAVARSSTGSGSVNEMGKPKIYGPQQPSYGPNIPKPVYPTKPVPRPQVQPYKPDYQPCNAKERRNLGQECCADEQCTYGCKTHHNKKMCMCPSHMILDMTGTPYKCSTTCSRWRDGGTCVLAMPFADDHNIVESNPDNNSTSSEEPIVNRIKCEDGNRNCTETSEIVP